MLPLEPEHVACADDQAGWGLITGGPLPRPHGKVIAQPVKVHDVKPIYPESAQQNRVQGSIIIEAVVSRTGCIANATVKRSPALELSGAALLAVMGWRYTPTRLNDEPVPVLMSVTVNFTLSQ